MAAAVRAEGRKALAVACDVGDGQQVEAAVQRTVDTFGRIDVLVNNAGYRIRARLEDLPRHEWDAMIATNLTGVFLFSQAVGRVMIQQNERQDRQRELGGRPLRRRAAWPPTPPPRPG